MAKKQKKKILEPGPVAILRDGFTELRVGDLVTSEFHIKCYGQIFEIEKITPHDACESGFMVLAHVQGTPEKKLKGSSGLGLDANWFLPVPKKP